MVEIIKQEGGKCKTLFLAQLEFIDSGWGFSPMNFFFTGYNPVLISTSKWLFNNFD